MLPGLTSYLCLLIRLCPSINGIFQPPAAFSLVFNPRNSALCLRLKTRSGLAGNQNLPFMDGHYIAFSVTVRLSALCMDNPPIFLNKFPPKIVKLETVKLPKNGNDIAEYCCNTCGLAIRLFNTTNRYLIISLFFTIDFQLLHDFCINLPKPC